MTTELSWKPVRHGLTYCSPACGGGCTIMAFDACTIAARELAERLGPGWEPRVAENLGWHYSAHFVVGSRRLDIWPRTGGGSYRATGLPKVLGYAVNMGPWSAQGTTPEATVRALHDILYAESGVLDLAIAALESVPR